ncbi:hypothetical protein [Solibacillus sp. CAU 1738]|uniref:hypothetical protein n=1 Tax=Solibacillus sp. CAU 1738 TaxID=3140363 RepID=UPI003261649F
MNDLKRILPPKRSNEKVAESLAIIKARIKQKEGRVKLQYRTILPTTVIAAILLIWSFSVSPSIDQITATSSSINKIYFVENFNTEPIFNLNAWYYIDTEQVKTTKEIIFLEQLGEDLRTSTEIDSAKNRNASSDYLLLFEDGKKQYLQFYSTFDDNRETGFVKDCVTQQILQLTDQRKQSLHDMNLKYRENNNFFNNFIKYLFSVIGICAFLLLIKKFTGYFPFQSNRPNKKRYFFYGLGAYLYVSIFLRGTSIYLFGTTHAIFIICAIFIPYAIYFLRNFKLTDRVRSMWELPLLLALLFFIGVIFSL